MNNRKGFALIAAVFIVLVMTLLAIVTSTFVSSDAQIAVKNHYSQDAFYISSAGMEYYLKLLDGDSDWSTPPADKIKDFSGGVFAITTTDESKNRITVTSTGVLTIWTTTYRRAVRATIKRTAGGVGGIAEDYAIYWGGEAVTGEANIGNNVAINGDLLMNSDLFIGNNAEVSGDAYVSGYIGGDTSNISGTYEVDYEVPADPPSLESSYFDGKIAIAAAQPAGDRTWSGNKTLSGTYYVNGNVIFRNNTTINITGTATVVATGTVLVRTGVTFGDNFHLIAGGIVVIENNVNIGKYGLWYSSVGFDVGNNAVVADIGIGEGTQFITPGDIDLGNNISYAGFIYAGGTLTLGNNTDFTGLIMASFIDDIGENSTLSLSPLVLDWDSVIGITGGGVARTDITDWDEVY